MAGSGTAHLRPSDETLLRVEDLVVEFPVGRSGLKVHAVSSVSLDIKEGETLGLVGESGCGKSTTGKAIMQLPRPNSGRVLFEGADMTRLGGEDLRRTRARLKMIFQDPISSLNPRRKVEAIIAEGLRIGATLEPPPKKIGFGLRVAAVLAFILAGMSILAGVGILIGAIVADLSLIEFLLLVVLIAVPAALAYVWITVGKGLAAARIWAVTIGVWLSAILLGVAFFLAVVNSQLVALAPALLLVAMLVVLCLPATRAGLPQPPEDLEDRVDQMMLTVGLDPGLQRGRRPHQFSGGQCQRISIARAVVTDPKLIICDEPVSALDVSVQAQILNLLEDMKGRYGLTLIFIAHDLAVVKNVSDRVVVMYLGKICEVGAPDDIFKQPAHPYTSALLAAIPVPDPAVRPEERTQVGGEIPSPVAPPSGCRFRTRCPKAQDKCVQEEPVIEEIRPGQFVACHFPLSPGETLPTRNGQTAAAAASPQPQG